MFVDSGNAVKVRDGGRMRCDRPMLMSCVFGKGYTFLPITVIVDAPVERPAAPFWTQQTGPAGCETRIASRLCFTCNILSSFRVSLRTLARCQSIGHLYSRSRF